MRLYLDSAPIIYLIEQSPRYAAAVDELVQNPTTQIITSELARLECRVKPLRDANTELLADYDQFFAEVATEIVPLSRAVVDRATEIRANYGFRTPDALHLAAALLFSCDQFLTNDGRLDRYEAITVTLVDDLLS